MFCPKCGNQMEQNVSFCNKCGASLNGDQSLNQNSINNNYDNQPITDSNGGYNNNYNNNPMNNNYYQNNPNNYVQFNNMNMPYNNYQPAYIGSGKSHKGLAIFAILVAVALIVIGIVTIINNTNGNYYFDRDPYDNPDDTGGSNNPGNNNYTTVVDAGKTYEEVTINSRDDAYQLITPHF